ncbi:MAG: amidase [bacterium]|nr:amidase [bacterium]
MADHGIFFQSLSELGARYRRAELSPVEVTEAFLDRIEREQARTKAYITVTADRALADARAAEKALRDGTDLGPLHGIPVALKDLFDTAGVRTTWGSKVRADFVPDTSATVATKLAQAGAVLLGKTNMVEFAFGPYGLNPHYGTPPNPWNPDCVPGGSSSGSGAAVARGLATAALGTDTGGSVRIPASFCGIVGLKPTLERVSRAGVMPLSWTLDSIGPMTRSVEDAALVFSAIAGPDPADPVTQGQVLVDVMAGLKGNVEGMRVGLVRDPFCTEADADVLAAFEQAVTVLAELGIAVEDFVFSEAEDELSEELAGRGSSTLMPVEGFAVFEDLIAECGEEWDPRIRGRIEAGAEISAPVYARVLRDRAALRQSAQKTLMAVDAVVCPTMLTGAPRIADVDRAPVRLTTRLVNFLGLCAVSVPCGFTESGLPVGLQMVGKPFDEATILKLAYAYEQATDWHLKRPPDG